MGREGRYFSGRREKRDVCGIASNGWGGGGVEEDKIVCTMGVIQSPRDGRVGDSASLNTVDGGMAHKETVGENMRMHGHWCVQ